MEAPTEPEERLAVSDAKIIPFRKRPPSKAELAVYRLVTRNWNPALRQIIFPEHYRCDQEGSAQEPRPPLR